MLSTALKGIVISPVFLALLLCQSALSSQNNGSIRDILQGSYSEEAILKTSDLYNSLDIGKEDKDGILDTVEWMASSNLSVDVILEYLNLVSELYDAGISIRDISLKAREGIAKGVSPERIIAVLNDRVQRLKDARVLVLTLENKGVEFLDKQMTYRILANYLSRGISSEEIMSKVYESDFGDYRALESVVR
ncbi:MAG: hypothetical protein ACC669_10000 [bacterium]